MAEIDEINPGVRRLVALLNSEGFETSDSGDGKTNVSAGMEGALDYPHVVIVTEPNKLVPDTYRLAFLMRARGIAVTPQGLNGGAFIQGSVDPADNSATIFLGNVDDTALALAEAHEYALNYNIPPRPLQIGQAS